jgi:hypothetical protein
LTVKARDTRTGRGQPELSKLGGIYDSHTFLIYYCGGSGDMVLTERQNDTVVYKRIHGVMPRTSHK